MRVETSNDVTQEPVEEDFARGGLLIRTKVDSVDDGLIPSVVTDAIE